MGELTEEQRSYCMSRIRSKWTKQEITIHNYLKGNKIRHKMHPDAPGHPDIILTDSKKAVFLHGCFWHKCPKCYVEPKSNKDYWVPKIERNKKRDKKNIEALKSKGYSVIVIWGHELKDAGQSISRLLQEKGVI